jgi:hypothetical protein
MCRIRFIISILMTAFLALACAGCGMMPRSIGSLPSGLGLKSQDTELRARVEADRFPTAKEAGL